MAVIDKIYGTQQQYNELEKWLLANNKKVIDSLYPKCGYEGLESRPILNFSKKTDKWLLANCPIIWVIDKIKYQYGINKSLEEIALKHGFINGLSIHSNTKYIKKSLYNAMEEYAAQKQGQILPLDSVLARFFVTMYELMTFTIESKYDRWFEIG